MPRGEFDRSARRARTREALLEAAARVYARRGFAGATLEEVAAEAGFTKGAVYAHFGSKENLLLALVEEYFAGQIAEQLALFDRDRATWERPLAGSERWMERLQERPERFRLFVELWAYSQRDERVRARLAGALAVLRATFARFAAESAADAGFDTPAAVSEQFANLMLGISLGLSMLRLTEPDAVPVGLLGTSLSVLIRATESSAHAQEAFARVAAREGPTDAASAVRYAARRPSDG
jgi:AcrR family transcriptional regulator